MIAPGPAALFGAMPWRMATTYRPHNRSRQLLLPASSPEWLPEDHLANLVADAVAAPDLCAFSARCAGDGRRRQPFEPSMIVKVYEYASGLHSSRKMAQRLAEDVAFRVLAANDVPAHRAVRELRQRSR